MNILALNPFKLSNNSNNNTFVSRNSNPRFGLTMAKPLSKDTVSFGCNRAPSKKVKEEAAFIISEALAKKIRARKEEPHNRKKQLLNEYFGDLIEQGVISFSNRLKGNRSIREKATTNGWGTLGLILEHMGDISGFCFILNDSKAFSEVNKRLLRLLQSRELEVVEGEYHRLAPKYKKNQIVESFDSIKPNELQKLKEGVNRIQNPTRQIFYDVDSRSGYSGLHLTLRSKDGEKSELQIMVMPISKVKKAENTTYKIKNGKSIEQKYAPIVETYLAEFKPLKKTASEAEKKAHEQLLAAMTKYTQEAYALAAQNPYNPNFEILKVENATTLTKKEKEILGKYSFDKIAILMEACERMEGKAN